MRWRSCFPGERIRMPRARFSNRRSRVPIWLWRADDFDSPDKLLRGLWPCRSATWGVLAGRRGAAGRGSSVGPAEVPAEARRAAPGVPARPRSWGSAAGLGQGPCAAHGRRRGKAGRLRGGGGGRRREGSPGSHTHGAADTGAAKSERAGGGGSAGPGRVVPRLPPRRGSARRGPAARPRGGGGAAQVAGADGCRSRRQPRSALPARLGLPGRAAARLFPSGPAPATGSGSEGPRYGRPGRRSHGSWRSLGALPASPHRLLGGRRGHGGR